MTERHSRSERGIRLVAMAGIAVLVGVLVGAFGVFGMRLIAAMAAMPKPAAALPAPPAGAASGPVAPVAAAAGMTAAAAVGPEVAAETRKLLDTGKTVYLQCAACHGPAGQSLIPAMAPNLAGSSVVNGPEERIVALVLNGIQPEGRFQGVMVPWKAMLTDEQIAGVLTYIRCQFGNAASAVAPEVVAQARTKYARQVMPLTRAELEAIGGEELPAGG